MKRLIVFILSSMICTIAFAQAPNLFNYQAVLHEANGNIITNQSKTIRIDISSDSAIVYSETHIKTTNIYGLINLQIGNGSVISGTFSSINWNRGAFYIKVSVDGNEMGTSQLLSVPYALFAAKAGNTFSGSYLDLTNKPSIPTDLSQMGTNAGNRVITNVSTPINNNDAANKYYVDAIKETIYNELLDAGLNGIVKDIDGNSYKTKKIGAQVWMVENLRTTKFNDGTLVPKITDNSTWGLRNTPAYCWYNNDSTSFFTMYGALYNWFVVKNANICPTGWHVPTDDDFNKLTNYLGGTSVAGGKMKEAGTEHWNSPNVGDNSSGFNALPSTGRNPDGTFPGDHTYAHYWTSTGNNAATADLWYLYNGNPTIAHYSDNKNNGYSIRCIKTEK